jgi:hypothetical protein
MSSYRKFTELVKFKNGVLFNDLTFQSTAFLAEHKSKLENLDVVDLLNRISILENKVTAQQEQITNNYSYIKILFDYFFKSLPEKII